MCPLIVQVFCHLTNLRHLTVAAVPNGEGNSEARLAGLDKVPPAVSRLHFLRSLRLLGHGTLRTLPAELCTLSK